MDSAAIPRLVTRAPCLIPNHRRSGCSMLVMKSSDLLERIYAFCRETKMAETTFGRRAVNDGKLVSRLYCGGSVTMGTVTRVETFMNEVLGEHSNTRPSEHAIRNASPHRIKPENNFRFFDNRQKYLTFVNTCSEKRVILNRVNANFEFIHPHPPAIRLFDAGVGDGSLLAHVMRAMHKRFALMPHYVVGKEISLEDTRLALEKMPDRFNEHPATVLVMTNLKYGEAPWLGAGSPTAEKLVWHEIALRGSTSAEFDEQIADLQPFLAQHWRARISQTSGNPVYEQPVVLVLYREDHRFLLDRVIPSPAGVHADFDLILASQPYRARAPIDFKVRRVLAPLARALGPGGRLIGIHSCGGDPGMEIIHAVWPDEQPFQANRHELLSATREELGEDAAGLSFNPYSDAQSIFRYEMYALPNEIGKDSATIGTSTLLAAWNDAAYVAQIEDERLEAAMADNSYLGATREVLRRYGGLWFNDESYVISRKRAFS